MMISRRNFLAVAGAAAAAAALTTEVQLNEHISWKQTHTRKRQLPTLSRDSTAPGKEKTQRSHYKCNDYINRNIHKLLDITIWKEFTSSPDVY